MSAETSGFFNAEVLEDGSYDRVYTAESFAKYFSQFVSNGVYANPATQLQVTQLSTPAMGVRVTAGNAFINGYWYSTTGKNIMLSDASGSTSRYDLIVLRLDNTTRSIYLDSIEGMPSVNPVVPSITRNSEKYELALAKIHITQASVEISNALITDLRPDNSVCGFVTGVVNQIETTELFKQFTAAFNEWFTKLKQDNQGASEEFTRLFTDWFNSIKGHLEGEPATALQLQIDELNKLSENRVYGFEDKVTKEADDGTITETFGDGRKIVTTEDSNGVITQRYYNSDGTLAKVKTITELEDGSVSEIVQGGV